MEINNLRHEIKTDRRVKGGIVVRHNAGRQKNIGQKGGVVVKDIVGGQKEKKRESGGSSDRHCREKGRRDERKW